MTAHASWPPPPQELDGDLGWGLGVVFRAYLKGSQSAFRDVPGGPRGFLVLKTVLVDGCTAQGALARRMGIDRTVMTYLLDDLESAGLLLRSPDPNDRRARRLTVTDAGAELVARMRGRLEHLEESLLESLPADERAALRSTVRRLALRLDAADPVLDQCTLADGLTD